MGSTVVVAEEAVESCASGAGTIIYGVVNGEKYCKSSKAMNWWNASSWCDAIGMELVDFSDCGCSDTVANCSGGCPNLAFNLTNQWMWTKKFVSKTNAYSISPNGARDTTGNLGYSRNPLCKKK